MRYRSCYWLAVVVLTSFSLGAAAVASPCQDKPRTVVSPDYLFFNGGVSALFSHSNVVVMGKVQGAPKQGKREVHRGERGGTPRIVHPEAQHNFRVVEVFKNSSEGAVSVGGSIVIDQEAGETEDEGRIIEIDRGKYDLLRPGATYVLFLVPRSSEKNHYVPLNGPQSVVLLSGGRPIPMHQEFDISGDSESLLTELRKLGTGVSK
jgi:hypothetical protein